MTDIPDEFTVEVAGHTCPHLEFTARVCRCGPIQDGVSLAFIDHAGKWQGGWVISYKDLVKMATCATAVRLR